MKSDVTTSLDEVTAGSAAKQLHAVGSSTANAGHLSFPYVIDAVTPAPSDMDVIARLAVLKPMDYDRVRKDEAKALGIQAKTLDEMVVAARKGTDDKTCVLFKDIEPFSEPVDPALLLSEVAITIRRFIVLDDHQADATALWVALTYFTSVADICPILIIDAPEKACAKTLLQNLVASMSHRPLAAANASGSALFRAVEDWGVSLFIDEADTFFKKNPELAGLVNAGYKRGGGVLRSEAKGDSFEPRLYSVYGPKSLAGIALERHLPDATMSRGVVINMRRKMQHETVDRMRHAEPGLFELLTSKLMRFADDYSGQVRSARPVLPDELSDRSQDSWESMLAIAQCAGTDWLKRATAAALALSGSSEESVSTGNELLSDIQCIFEKKGVTKIRTTDLIGALLADDELSWATYNRGRPLSPRQLAKQLSVYSISPKTVRHGNETPKGYDAAQFADAFARYLGTPEKLQQQRNASTTAEANRSEFPTHTLDEQTLDCGGVADTKSDPATHPPDVTF